MKIYKQIVDWIKHNQFIFFVTLFFCLILALLALIYSKLHEIKWLLYVAGIIMTAILWIIVEIGMHFFLYNSLFENKNKSNKMKDEDGLELGPQPKPNDYRIWKGTVAEFFERAADTIKDKED